MNLDRALRDDIAYYRPLNDDFAYIDLSLDLRAIADDEHVFGKHFSFEATVNPDGAFEGQLAFELRASTEERRDLTCRSLSCCNHRAATVSETYRWSLASMSISPDAGHFNGCTNG